jgi:adenylate cyclase
VAADFDFEALGLLDGLDGEARKERAELIEWLLDRGFSIDHICGSAAAPLMLPAHKVLGDDGRYVSAREVCEASGIELQLLQRLQRAIGLQIDDPDAAVLLRADGEAAAGAKFFLDLGFDPDDTVAMMRVVIENLGHVAAIMREAALKTLLRPGASEVELAQASEQLALRCPDNRAGDGGPVTPRTAPLVRDGRRHCRRKGGGDAAGWAHRDGVFCRPCRLHEAG